MKMSVSQVQGLSKIELRLELDKFRKGPGQGFDIVKVIRYIWTFLRVVAAFVNAVDGVMGDDFLAAGHSGRKLTDKIPIV